MNRDGHNQENHAAELEAPAYMSVRQRLEWEVSQLADGTLPADRRAEVEAALVSDASLRDDFAAHRRVQALLSESPVSVDLGAMRNEIMAAIGREPAFGAAEEPRREAAGGSAGLAELLARWWVTVTAAAAALVVGLSAGIIFFGSGPGGGGGGADVVASGTPVFSQLEVEGPVAILQQSQSSEQQMIALTVTGPDYRVILDPQDEAPLPSYTYSYGGSAVIDTPSRMIIASVDEE